jgi:hypothetical protein
MAVTNPPLTEQPSLNFTLLELIKLANDLEQQNIKLLQDIRDATDFADLKVRIDS